MYTDVIFGRVLWIGLSSWHFFLMFIYFFRVRLKICRGRRRPKCQLSAESTISAKKLHYVYNMIFL